MIFNNGKLAVPVVEFDPSEIQEAAILMRQGIQTASGSPKNNGRALSLG